MRALQVESPECGACPLISTIGGGIYRAVWELHRFGEVILVPSGGWPAKPRVLRLGLLLM
jgi:hypothetical protein